MTLAKFVETLVVVGVGSLVIAAIMEVLKHKKYGDEATRNQMYGWAVLFSVIVTPVLYFGFELIGKPIAMVLYAVIIFFVQKEIDMKAVRPFVKKFIVKKVEEL